MAMNKGEKEKFEALEFRNARLSHNITELEHTLRIKSRMLEIKLRDMSDDEVDDLRLAVIKGE